MSGARFALALLGALASSPAPACPPPLPGVPEPKPPTDEELARFVDRSFDRIVYGKVVRGSDKRGIARFRVLHVYRGKLAPGQTIAIENGTSLRAMNPCPGMVPDFVPPLQRGDTGVIGWRDGPRVQFLDTRLLRAMFAAGYIRSARAQRVGTGSAPE